MKPEDWFKNAKAYFWEESFAIIKSNQTYPEAFANITDQNEITVIIDQNKLRNTRYPEHNNKKMSALEKNWKILTLDVVFPLNAVGILARIAGILAEKGISIMAISAYSRDHFLIREENMDKAILALESIGISAK